ncbi:UDP-N-acetylmuramate dehydrogenase [bacterium]|nr:UDP-N-acetylmuramate dehydrogenase [bacterium]
MTEYFEKDFDIKNYTTFKIGGKISEAYFPDNIDEFVRLLQKYPNIPVLGNLSNILISSSGYDGKVILTHKMNNISIDGTTVIADCGVKGPKLSQQVCAANLSGFEFMIGFPGSVGGEVYMNASAHGQCISDNIRTVTCYRRGHGVVKYSKDDMGFDYRTSRCQKDNLVVLQAKFELQTKDSEEIKKQMDENLKFRKDHQPSLVLPNCGSIFKNPIGNPAGRLLESVGAKQLNAGEVRVWRNHSNFIVNTGNGTSMDVLSLMYELRERVKDTYNIALEPEIKYLGSNKEELKIWQKLNQ